MPDDPRAKNNARFAEYMRRLHSTPAPLPPDEAATDGDAQAQAAWAAIEARLRRRGPSPLRAAYGPWKVMDEARRTVPAVLLPEANTEGQPVNTGSAQNALQQPAEAAGSLQDAKGARHTRAGGQQDAVASRVTNTHRLRCGENGHQCGWCHYCRQKSGRPCPATCHHCQMAAVEAADALAHPDEAGALLTHPADLAKGKKKPERVRGFQI